MTVSKLTLLLPLFLISQLCNAVSVQESALNNGVIGEWQANHVETNKDWQAAWIWHEKGSNNNLMLFRKSFTLTGDAVNAVLKITASSVYKLYVNGEYVNRGPARSAPHHQSFDQLNISSLLQLGKNTLAIQVHAQDMLNSYASPGRAGLLAELLLNDKILVKTDASWKVSKDPSWRDNSPKMSRFHQEVNDSVDLRLALHDWQSLEFNDSDWQNATELMRNNGWPTAQKNDSAHAITPPWVSLVKRDIQYLKEQSLTAKKLVSAQYIDDYFTSKISFPKKIKSIPKVSLERDNKALQFSTYPINLESSDKPLLLVFDLGEVKNGLPEFTIKGSAGDKVEVIAIPYMINSKFTYHMVDANLIDRVVLSGKTDYWQAQYFKPTRYLGIVVKPSNTMEISHFGLHQLSFELHEQSSIKSASATWITDYVNASKKTIKVATTDAYTDNYRERRQYAQTGFYAALGNYYTFANHTLQRRYLIQTAQEQMANGLMPAYGPLQTDDYMVILDSNSLWIRSLKNYFLYSGDKNTVLQLMPAATKMMALLNSFTNSDGLIDNPPYAYWLDHAKNDRRGANLNLNGHYLGALEDFVELNAWLGISDVRQYGEQAKRVRTAINTKFWNEDKGLFVDALIDGEQSNQYSEHANAMALALNIATKQQADMVIKTLLDDTPDNYITRANGMTMVTPAMSYFLHKGIANYGYIDESFALMRKRFDKMLAPQYNGTLWEEWWLDGTGRSGTFINNGRTRSDAQTESAFAPALFAEYLLGIKPIEPGMRTITLAKRKHSISNMEGTVATPYGLLKIQWQYTTPKQQALLIDVPNGVIIKLDRHSLGFNGEQYQQINSGTHHIEF
ncbi:alpha-L-rhamnosidase N-terminal domain-containing protein [Thalassotalea nanhaiensis]|uniref:Alpha-L-rhamnosidase N-terminal domain-containing protein n=1 Tax=Thalassotalea nanhaiensis TaxID=3065648 RepID=A0ABY9TKA8_9GAMM|nr:alpha-L-rhamnosidase N-terminal domain-containing protein [Colwelliaceae bacterium SQ345]